MARQAETDASQRDPAHGFDAGGSPAPDAIAPRPDGGDAASPDAGFDAGTDAGAVGDAGFDAGVDAGSRPCTPGQLVLPTRATNASTWAPGNVCAQNNVLVQDDAVAGLDLFGDAVVGCDLGTWPGSEPCGCVAVDFGQPLPVDYLTIRAGSTANACGQPCGVGQCDTGQTGRVGYGVDEATYFDNPTSLVLNDPTLQPYQIDVDGMLQWVVVCRIAFSEDRDDIVVDSVTATCL